MKPLIHALHRFGRDERGTLLVEAVMVLPFMLWAYIGLFVYWDAFRSINTVQKAAYTVSDMISREMLPITPAYLDGMDAMVERLVDQDQDVAMRVTSVFYDAANDRNEVHWSMSPNRAMRPLTTGMLEEYQKQIPAMSDGDFVVIVEVSVNYAPAFNVGVSEMELKQFIVTRPRFVPRICMADLPCS